MTNIAVQRIQREFREVVSDESSRSLFHIEANESDLLNLIGYVSGPPETPYEGGRFQLEIKVPETYPFSPPKVRFITRIWHPNISSVTGAICLDILKDQWAAAMTMRTVLLSLQTLLALPEPSDPQDAVVARQYIDNLDLFTLTANYWTYIYALPNNSVSTHIRFKMNPSLAKFPTATASMPVAKFKDFNAKIKRLVEYMNVDENKAMHALSSQSWNIDKASQSLL